MGWSAFRAEGNTQAVAVTTVASTAVQALSFNGEPICNNFILSNATTQPVFVAVGPTNSVTAVIPVPGTPQRGYWLGPNAAQSVTESPNTWFSAIAGTGTSTVYITPGDGL
jgi:hypothetical protein